MLHSNRTVIVTRDGATFDQPLSPDEWDSFMREGATVIIYAVANGAQLEIARSVGLANTAFFDGLQGPHQVSLLPSDGALRPGIHWEGFVQNNQRRAAQIFKEIPNG